MFNAIINIPEVTNFMLFKFTYNLNIGESANTRKTEKTESCEEEQKKEQRDSDQEIMSHADITQRKHIYHVNRWKEGIIGIFSITGG